MRSWRSQANLAIVTDAAISKERQEYGHRLSNTLADALNFIVQGKNHEAFIESISTKIIGQALKLQQRFVTSTKLFSMGTHTRVHSGQNFEGDISQLEDLECKNLITNMRKLHVDNSKSVNQLHQELYIVFSLCPALIVSRVSGGRSIEEHVIVTKEEMLVAWKEGEGGEASILKAADTSESWLHRILGTLHRIP